MSSDDCPCCSQLPYSDCCKPYHDGKEPSTALALMRSRYSAYAEDLPFYIQKTTHPNSPHFESDLMKWTLSIHQFCAATRFIRLEIFSYGADWVQFCAHLEQNNHPVQLHEKSFFKELNGCWKYDLAFS